MLYGVVELLACWSSKFKRHRAMVIWSMVLLCLMWGIWREAHTFERNERSIPYMKLSFFELSNALGISTFNSLQDLLDSCTC